MTKNIIGTCLFLFIIIHIVVCSDSIHNMDEIFQDFPLLLQENVYHAQHVKFISGKIRHWYNQSKTPLVFYATGRPGCGKTKTFTAIEKAFYGCGGVFQNKKCYLQINGITYRNETLAEMRRLLNDRIVSFINSNFPHCNLITVTVEYSQVIHYALSSVILHALRQETMQGLSDQVYMGRVLFLIAGNKGYEGCVPDETASILSVVELDGSSLDVDRNHTNKRTFSEIDKEIEKDHLFVNQMVNESEFDSKLLHLSKKEREFYMRQANDFMTMPSTSLLLFKPADLQGVAEMKVKEYTYRINQLGTNVLIAWNIKETATLLLEHVKKHPNFYYRTGGYIQSHLETWFYHLQRQYRVLDQVILTSASILQTEHLQKRSDYEKAFSELDLECEEGEMADVLIKLLLTYGNNEDFSKGLRALFKDDDKLSCRWNSKVVHIGKSDWTSYLDWSSFLVEKVPIFNVYEFPMEVVDKYLENEQQIASAMIRKCPPWDTNNFFE